MRFESNADDDMQPLSLTFGKITFDSLASWGGANKTTDNESVIRLPRTTVYSNLDGPRHNCSPFPLTKDINNRFILWDGDVVTLEVDAITNIVHNNSLTEHNLRTERIILAGGEQLKNDLLNCKDWHTGIVRVTAGYNLPAKYILHTTVPLNHSNNINNNNNNKDNSNTQAHTASAECALHSYYHSILCKAKECNLDTIAITSFSLKQRNQFINDNSAHIALRTIRKFLEQCKTLTVVLCVCTNERGIYEVLAPLYFPRDNLEERSAQWQLPRDIGGDCGEPNNHYHLDRQIRIIRNPQHRVSLRQSDDESETSPHDMEGNNSDLESGFTDMNGISLNTYPSNVHSYSQMQSELDRQHLLGNSPTAGIYQSVVADGIEGIEHQERYERLLHRAQVEDLTEVSGIGCLYQSGVDRLGRPVIVFCGKWFPANNIDLEKALLYLIKLLDPIVKGDYVIAYFHTLTSTNNYPSLHWLREVYSVLPYKYKKNLKAFYIVHPTFWTKMMTWWFTTFMAPAIKAKVHSLPGVEHLYSAITKDQLEIPAYITEYDMATNGLHYFTPVTSTTTTPAAS